MVDYNCYNFFHNHLSIEEFLIVVITILAIQVTLDKGSIIDIIAVVQTEVTIISDK